MRPVLTTAEMADVDAQALKTTTLDVLVERAGTAVALAAVDVMGGSYGRRVVAICGKGNNGADGRVAARLLEARGAKVTVVPAGSPDSIGSPGLQIDLVIDAAYGTGFRGTYVAPAVAPGVPVLAVDIPSGVAGDTGVAQGRPLAAVRTVTFVAAKPGLLMGDGARLAGEVVVVDIGLAGKGSSIGWMEDADIAALLPPRRVDGHKWSAAVLVVAGSPGMTGAAQLCARSAFRAGSGMVRLGVPGGALGDLDAGEAVGVTLAEAGWADAALEAAERCRAMVVGPGLGRAKPAGDDVRRLLAAVKVPIVVDADGLTGLGRVDRMPIEREAPAVLTPHDGEYAALLGEPPGPDRIEAARRLAAVTGCIALVKGSTTAVADPSGRVVVATAGTPALATAGSGDVLSGVIAAFLARGMPPLEAAALAAHVHGRAGQLGPGSGTVAGDLPMLVAQVLDGRRND